ncbi:MAG: hypothetical protein K1V87_00795 [Muribaculum sp.]
MRILSILIILAIGIGNAHAARPIHGGYYDRDSVEARLRTLPLHIIEGIWQFPSDGATVVIERSRHDGPMTDEAVTYSMTLLKSPMRSLLPGTEMGTLKPTAKRGVYSAVLYTDTDGGQRLLKPKNFTLTLNDDGHLSFHKHGSSIKVSIWRLLPYVSRLGIRVHNDKPRDLDGCVRVFPMSKDGPVEPRYL